MSTILLWCSRCAVGDHTRCRAEDVSVPPTGAKKAPYAGMHDYPYGRQCPCANEGHGMVEA